MQNDSNKIYDFSIIICCYNPDIEKLKKTIISSYKQKNVSYEIIISDDGSKVKYKDEIKKWININNIQHVTYNFLEKNVGTVKNIISAAKLSKGEYIKTISPGDYFYDEYSLEEYKKGIELSHAYIVYSDAVYYNNHDIVMQNALTHNKMMYKKNVKNTFCLYNGNILGAAFVGKRELFINDLPRIEDKIIYLEDRPMIYMTILDGKTVYPVKKQLIWYEYGTGISTKEQANPKLIKDIDSLYNFLKEDYPNNKYVNKMLKKYNSTKMNKIKKSFFLLFNFPSAYIYKLRYKICGVLKNNINISKIDDITTL